MKKVLCLLLSLFLLGLNCPSAVAADTVYKKLNLVTPIPQTIASNTITVDLQPSNYSSEYKKARTIVSVCTSPGKLCGNWQLNEYPDTNPIKVEVDADYRAPKVFVLGLNDNRIAFSFEKAGQYYVHIVKSFSRNIKSVDPSFWGNVNLEWTVEEIEFPIKVTDISTGGIDVRVLAEAGIKHNPYPILDCPKKVTNTKQTISCKLSYGFYEPEYRIIVERSEPFKVCAYKVEHTLSECDEKQKPYFSKKIELGFDSVSTVKIPISKDVDTAIYLRWDNATIPYDQNKADFQYYFNKPIRYSPTKKGNSNLGKYERKCKTVTTRVIPQPGELTSSTLNGGGGLPLSTTSQVCENVWVPKR